MRVPLTELLVADLADDIAVAPDGSRHEWLARVAAWAAAMRPHAGADVALTLDDGFEFSAALFAAWSTGATPWLPADGLAATGQRLRELGVAFPDAPHTAAKAGAAAPFAALSADACELVLFTSGSSGEPAAIRKSLRQLDAEVDALERSFGTMLGDAVVHGTVANHHIYGLLFRVLWPLSSRRAAARQRIVYNEQLATLGPGPVALVASPAHLKRLPDAPGGWSQLVAALRLVFSSGGALPADAALDVAARWKQAPVEVFGSTETGGIAWRRADGGHSAWQCLPGVEWRLDGERLQVRSPHLDAAGWYTTSDRARAGGDGGFVLLGRADRIVKIEERRISLDAIEARLRASPLLQELRVVPLPGPRVLLAVAAVPSAHGHALLATHGRPALAKHLREWLSGHCDPIALPRRWRFLDTLPVDVRGKTSERALAALFRPLMPVPTWTAREPHAATATLRAAPELAAFEGHFPAAPILPGVVLVDWAVRLGREAFGVPGMPLRMEALKFQQLVRPGAELTVSLTWSGGVLGFDFVSAAGVHGRGRLRFGPASS